MYELLHDLANVLKLRILENFKKILEKPGIKDRYPADHLDSKLWELRHKIAKKKKKRSKIFHIKACFIYFKNFSRVFCPGLKAFLLTSLKVKYVTPDLEIKM